MCYSFKRNSKTGRTVNITVIILVTIVKPERYSVRLNDANTPSKPIVGSNNKGTGEKYLNAAAKSGLFKREAIGEAKIKSVNEKTPPKTTKMAVSLVIISFASSMGLLGMKYE